MKKDEEGKDEKVWKSWIEKSKKCGLSLLNSKECNYPKFYRF